MSIVHFKKSGTIFQIARFKIVSFLSIEHRHTGRGGRRDAQ